MGNIYIYIYTHVIIQYVDRNDYMQDAAKLQTNKLRIRSLSQRVS